MTVYYANSLYHHGIKGQKWGVRRFQKKDGSLTPAGRKRYDDDGPSQKKQKEYKIPKNKSLHRLKIEEKYKAKGMSEKEAEQAAAKRIRGEQFAVGAAAVTVAACVAYNKYRNHNVDKVLKNAEFHRIVADSDPNAPIRKDGARYVAYNKNDRMKYRGMYGDTLNQQITADKAATKQMVDDAIKRGDLNSIDANKTEKIMNKAVYDMTIKSKGNIKVASEKRARETFEKLFNDDPEFRKNFKSRAYDLQLEFRDKKGLSDTVEKIVKNETVSTKELKSKAYDAFNIMLVDNDQKGRSIQKKFYDALKEQGMNAVQDINDKKYSGYNTKNPLILFDGDFEYSREKIALGQIEKDKKKSMHQLVTGPLVAQGMGIVAALSASPIVDSRTIQKQMIEYKREHPDTKMSDAELKKMFKKQIKDKYKNKK